MMTLQADDVVPLQDWELAWRITDDRWAALPDGLLRRIKPLSAGAARRVRTVGIACQPVIGRSVAEPFAVTREQSLEASGARDDGGCQVWFRDLPIAPDDRVFLSWSMGEGVAAVTDWETFRETWEDLWYPFDELFLFDDIGDWVVRFGPDEVVRFAEKVVKPVGA